MMATGTAPGLPVPAAVLAAFGIRGRVLSVTAVGGAWSNQVYRLEATTGTFALKELRNPWQDPGWLKWLAAAWDFEQLAFASGVEMPEPVSNRSDGGPLAWVETADDPAGVVPVRVHRWVDGVPPGPGAVSPEVAGWAGRTLARLHGLAAPPADRAVFPGPEVSTQTADDWPELARLAVEAGAPWAGQVLDVLPVVAEVARLAVRASSRPGAEVMSHGDIDQKNLILAACGPVLCDWDLAMPVVPRREVADVAMSLAGWERRDIALAVVRAYRDCGGQANDLGPEDLGPSMMIGLDWVEFNISRAIGARPGIAGEVERSDGLVPGLLARIPAELAAAQRAAEMLRL
jgi:Ser/Thr protein kinase RdoA (MazF antagonist)